MDTSGSSSQMPNMQMLVLLLLLYLNIPANETQVQAIKRQAQYVKEKHLYYDGRMCPDSSKTERCIS